ncbi:MAG TPA: CotH kinase family protein [Chryseolinea sp.]
MMKFVCVCLSCLLIGVSLFAQVDAIVPFTSSNLPIVVLKTTVPIVDDPKTTATMGIIDNWPDRNHLSDPSNIYEGSIGIEIRGSSSQMFPKKQYGIELRDANGDGSAASLLSMPEEEDWILFAPYNDKSLMRDAMAYRMARSLGRYAPRTKFCELVLDDVYMGVYVVIEKIKRDKNRVDINKLDPDEISGGDVTGGYIFKIDKTTGGNEDGWTSAYKPPHAKDQKVQFLYEYPKTDEIAAEQKAYIKKYVSDFESTLAGNGFADAVTGYAKFIDVASFVDYFIIQEVTKNVDGYRLSTFMYKQRDADGGKLFMGPVWDFNLGFGNANYCTGGSPEGFVLDFNSICPDDYWLIPFWWKRLLQDETFSDKVAARWGELRSGAFSEENLHGYIDSVASVLNVEAQGRNFQAWNVLNKYVWPNYYIGATFQSEVSWLKSWISQRLTWLDQHMPLLITDAEQFSAGQEQVNAYPNPFSSSVVLDYAVQNSGAVNILISDSMGRSIKFVKIDHDSAGRYSYVWQCDTGGSIYYYFVRQGSKLIGEGKLLRK